MGGKSVYIRQSALLAIMAQARPCQLLLGRGDNPYQL